MQRLTVLVVLAMVLGLVHRVARAQITARWQPIASGNGSVAAMYPSAATTADPLLLNMQTWDLMVTTTGNWSSAGLRATLPPGSAFYRSTSAAITKPQVTVPNREFWTFIRAPADGVGDHLVINITGGFPQGAPLSNGTANGNNTPGVLSASWGDLQHDFPGTFQVARLTFPLGVLPDVLTADQGAMFSFTAQVSPAASVAIPELPEPACGAGALLLTFCVAAAGRPQRSCSL